MKRSVLLSIILPLFIFGLSGCTVILQKGRRSDIEKIQSLNEELDTLRNAKGLLEQRLSDEIDSQKVRVSMGERGLVITFVAEVLFDSGKAKLKEESLPIMDKVVRILQEEVPDNDIGVEGHTDNQPIKYSKWDSNWELSVHRALSVLRYFEEQGVNPVRLSVSGYSEYRPVGSNDTSEGRQLNRRVEIVILSKPAGNAQSRKSKVESDDSTYEKELK